MDHNAQSIFQQSASAIESSVMRERAYAMSERPPTPPSDFPTQCRLIGSHVSAAMNSYVGVTCLAQRFRGIRTVKSRTVLRNLEASCELCTLISYTNVVSRSFALLGKCACIVRLPIVRAELRNFRAISSAKRDRTS